MTYWERRQKELIDQLERDEAALKKKLAKEYDRQARELEKEIALYYQKYGVDNVIQYRVLLETLPAEDKRLLIERMEAFAEKYPQYRNLLPVRESIYKLDRLEGLRRSILMQQLEIGAVEQEELRQHLERNALRAANKAADTLGFGSSFYTVDSDTVKKLINARWAGDGENFSGRIWKNRSRLAQYLHTDFAQAVARGDSVERCISRLKERFSDVSRRDMFRLVYTEGTFVCNEAAITPFEDMVEQYQYSAILDNKTSEICRALHGQVFNVADRKAGVNFPPMHPNCRSSFVPYVEDWDAWIDDYVAKRGGDSKTAGKIEDRLQKGHESGIINIKKASGAKKTPGWEERHAIRMYQEIEKRRTDCKRIAKNTGFSLSDIETVKRHVFIEMHRFRDGRVEKFHPDFQQAQAWDRLTQGTHTDLDILFLRHELEEATIMREQGLVYEDAHDLANLKYNWWKEFSEGK